MRFGLGVPTGTEGMIYPVPYADPAQAVDLAVRAEQLGFDSVWGNDHISTQAYVRAEFEQPPRFYDPYLYLSYVAARTTKIRLATAITVMTFRHPVVLAKQAMTLDQLSGGRSSSASASAPTARRPRPCGPAGRCTGASTPPSSCRHVRYCSASGVRRSKAST